MTDRVADMVAENKNIAINIKLEIQFGEGVGHGGWLIGSKLFRPEAQGGIAGPDAPKIQALPEWGGAGLTLAWIFVKDLSTCTGGPQR